VVDGTRPGCWPSGLEAELEFLCANLVVEAASAGQLARTGRILDRFCRFAAIGHRLGSLAEVTVEVATSFVFAPNGNGSAPSVSTLHWRRTALRLLFRAGRRAGLVSGDATLDLVLPARSSLSVRPLSDDEVALCRSVAQWSLVGSRRATAWALAEATCRSCEIPHVTAADVDLETGRVLLAGGKVTDPRLGQLTDWGSSQVRARCADLSDPSTPLVYGGRSPAAAGQVSAAGALVDVLVRAGLHGEPDVRPGSVAAWAGRRVLDETGRIDLAARALGVRSLDRAAGIVGWDWRDNPGAGKG